MPDEIAIERLSIAYDRRMSRHSNGMYDFDDDRQRDDSDPWDLEQGPAGPDTWWPEAYDE